MRLTIRSILVATFSAAAQAYSRATPYVMWLLKGVLAGNTPRKVFVKTVSGFRIQYAISMLTRLAVQDGLVCMGNHLATSLFDHLYHHGLLCDSTHYVSLVARRVLHDVHDLQVPLVLDDRPARFTRDRWIVLHQGIANCLCRTLH